MSRKYYVPVEVNNQSVSEEVVAWYFPLLTSGQYLAKKVVKAYCPVLINGQSVSKLFYEAGGAPASGNWDFYETAATGFLDCHYYSYAQTITKYNNGIAYFAFMSGLSDGRGNYWYFPVTLSPDDDAVDIYADRNGQVIPYSPIVGSIVYKNKTWYYEYDSMGFYQQHQAEYPADFSPDCLLDGVPYWDDEQDWYDMDAFVSEQLLSKIYNSCLTQDYQVGETYNLNYGDIKRTIRKAFGVFIYKRIDMKSDTRYNSLVNNLETVINDLVSFVGNDKWIGISITKNFIYTTGILRIEVMAGSPSLNNKTIESKQTVDDYTHCRLGSSYVSYPRRRRVSIASDGTISYETITATGTWDVIGVRVEMSSSGGNNYYTVSSSNAGLNV